MIFHTRKVSVFAHITQAIKGSYMNEEKARILALTEMIMQLFCCPAEKAKQVIIESFVVESYDLGIKK